MSEPSDPSTSVDESTQPATPSAKKEVKLSSADARELQERRTKDLIESTLKGLVKHYWWVVTLPVVALTACGWVELRDMAEMAAAEQVEEILSSHENVRDEALDQLAQIDLDTRALKLRLESLGPQVEAIVAEPLDDVLDRVEALNRLSPDADRLVDIGVQLERQIDELAEALERQRVFVREARITSFKAGSTLEVASGADICVGYPNPPPIENPLGPREADDPTNCAVTFSPATGEVWSAVAPRGQNCRAVCFWLEIEDPAAPRARGVNP